MVKGLRLKVRSRNISSKKTRTQEIRFPGVPVAYTNPEHAEARNIQEPSATAAEASCSKKQKIEEDWSAVRDELASVGLSLELPVSHTCSICFQHVEQPIRCLDCHSMFICCITCEQKVHKFTLHKPEIWQVVFSVNTNYLKNMIYCVMVYT